MTVYDVMNGRVFDADERYKDNRLSELITVEWATRIHEEHKY